MAMKLLQAKVPEHERAELVKIAQEKGIPLSELVRRLLSKALREKHHEQV